MQILQKKLLLFNFDVTKQKKTFDDDVGEVVVYEWRAIYLQ